MTVKAMNKKRRKKLIVIIALLLAGVTPLPLAA